MSAKNLPARLILTEWLSEHPSEQMMRWWILTEQQRRQVVSLIVAELGEPAVEVLVPLEALTAMGEAGQEHGMVVWGMG